MSGRTTNVQPADLLETIIARASALLGTAHGFIYLIEPDGRHLVVHHGVGLFASYVGYRLAVEDATKAQIVKLRFFAGLENREIAEMLGSSERTVERA